jgi:hypothetical protein
MKRLLVLLFIFTMVMAMVGCSGGNDAVQNALISMASYQICRDNPEAVEAIKIVCVSPQIDLGAKLAELYAKYETEVEDPFIRAQVNILINAFLEEYGIDVSDPSFDFSVLDGDEIRPFVDAICVGAAAAEAAQ